MLPQPPRSRRPPAFEVTVEEERRRVVHEHHLHQRQKLERRRERRTLPDLPPRMADLDEQEFMHMMEMEMKSRMHREIERERHMKAMLEHEREQGRGYADDCYYGYNDLPRRPDERKFIGPSGRTSDYHRQRPF